MTNYDDIRFRAVIDWIQFEVRTQTPTNAPALRRHGNLSYVKPLDPSAGGAATQFRFRIHDVESWRDLAAKFDKLRTLNPIASVSVTAIEVSLDAYSRTHNRDHLADLALGFYKFLSKPVSSNRRFSGRYKSDTMGISGLAHMKRHLGLGRALCIGDTNNAEYQQIYLKQTDHNKKPLQIGDHRARIEVRLAENALPATSLDDWIDFDFRRLRPYFSFRALRPNLSSLENVVADAATQIGERRSHDRRCRFSRLTKADKQLNRRAYDSLKELNRRLKA